MIQEEQQRIISNYHHHQQQHQQNQQHQHHQPLWQRCRFSHDRKTRISPIPIDLKQLIVDTMESRNTDNKNRYASGENDVWAELQRRESDVLIAAELGKALLEKNEELMKQQEQLIEDYSTKIEKLEQEKHALRKKLSLAEEEKDQRIVELQADLNELHVKLQTQENSIRHTEKEKALLIEELSNQNARLIEQIEKAHATEAKLQTQIQEIKEQYNNRRTSLQDHVNSLESIKTELSLTTEKRQELEKRLEVALEEKDNLSMALEEASDRIHMLERHLNEQKLQLENTVQALERSQREYNVLSDRLAADNYTNTASRKSLQYEMDCEEDEGSFSFAGTKPNRLWMEARSVYIQLKSLVDSLKIGHDDDSGLHSDISVDMESMNNTSSGASYSQWSDNELNTNTVDFKCGMLSAMSDELTRLLLNFDAVHFKKMLDQTRQLMLEQEEEIKKNHQLIQEMESKLIITDVKLKNAQEEREQAQNDLLQNNDNNELLAKAQMEKDKANERRTKAEVDLAKTRVELMQTNSQLLESIQQKVELSQQLEQWQMDMQELIHEQMQSKMINNRSAPATDIHNSNNNKMTANLARRLSTYKFWSLFQR